MELGVQVEQRAKAAGRPVRRFSLSTWVIYDGGLDKSSKRGSESGRIQNVFLQRHPARLDDGLRNVREGAAG